jgi:hypothetical protein
VDAMSGDRLSFGCTQSTMVVAGSRDGGKWGSRNL